jgi:hypothetical protein
VNKPVREWHVKAAAEWLNDADFVKGMSETIAAHDPGTAAEGDGSYRDLWQQCECRAGELRSRALAAEARLEQAVGHVSELLDAAQWMTGSNDFSPEGQAHRGWLKFRPALERARAFLAQEPIAALAAGKEEE